MALGAVAAGLATGGIAYAGTHKSVTLDVDGEVSQVSTFAGSVDGVLEQADVPVGANDVVAPGLDAPLGSGDEVVVRHAHQVPLLINQVESTVWTTALSAQEALADLSARGDDVLLVASRSDANGRASLDLDLTPGAPVDVIVDGTTRTLADGAISVPTALNALDITPGPLDRVTVREPAQGSPVAIVVERVAVGESTELVAVEFETTTTQDPSSYRGERAVTSAGQAGERTQVYRVTTVDGVETERELLSDTLTTAPVTRVIAVGTKERPAPAPAPRPGPARASAPAEARASAPAGSQSAGGLNWAALAQCESGGNPTIVSSSGTYHGLYQFSVGTWRSVGGTGLPSQASPAEQTQRAQMLYARSGAGQWPACGPRLFS